MTSRRLLMEEEEQRRRDLIDQGIDPSAADAGMGYLPEFGVAPPPEATPAPSAPEHVGDPVAPAPPPSQFGYTPGFFEEAPAEVPSEPEEIPAPEPILARMSPGSAPKAEAPLSPPPLVNAPEKGFSLGDMGVDKADRVNQALYAAFSNRPLGDSFFTQPKQDQLKEQQIAQMKAALLARHQKAGVDADPAAREPDSDVSVRYRELVKRSRVGAKFATDNPAFERMSKADLAPIFDKYIVNSETRSFVEDDKTERGKDLAEIRGGNAVELEGKKQEGRVALQDDKQTFHKDVVMPQQLDIADKRITEQQRKNREELVKAYSGRIPKGTNAVFGQTRRIASLVDSMGGADNLKGVGLVQGALPNFVTEKGYGPEYIEFRQIVQELINDWNTKKFGANFTPEEMKRAERAMTAVKGGRSVFEVMNGIKQIQQIASANLEQSIGSAPDDVKAAMRERFGQPVGDIFTSQELPEIDTGTGQDVVGSAKEAAGAALDTAAEVIEPAAEELGVAGVTAAIPPRKKAAGKKTVVKKQHNRAAKKTRFTYSDGTVEEVDGLR